MSEDTGRGQGVGVAWFLAGLGVGALVGILYAPKSGRETREDLAQRGREGSEYLRNRDSAGCRASGHDGRQGQGADEPVCWARP